MMHFSEHPDTLSSASEWQAVTAVGKVVWDNLPLLVAMDMLLAITALPAALIAFLAGGLFAPIVAALTIGPVWAGCIATTDQMLHAEETSPGILLRNIRSHVRSGIGVSLAPAAIFTVILATLRIYDAHPSQTWLLLPLYIDGCVAVAILLAQPAIFSIVTRTQLRGRGLWAASLGVVAASPMIVVGLVAFAIVVWLLVRISGPAVLLLMPAPLAIYLSAATWSVIKRGRPRAVRGMIRRSKYFGDH